MTEKQLDFGKRSIEKVKKMWRLYILGENPTELKEEFSLFPDNMLMIGTGRHEMYQTKDAFIMGMSADQLESRDIQFELPDEWYEVQHITKDVCVVYGSIWAREKVQAGQTIFVDMQGSRFTIVCRDTPTGVEMCSIHHSMPYLDQGSDEYYPKTLASLAKELEHTAELDRMTGLYSRYNMEQKVSKAISEEDGCFFVLDLDNFKVINDTMGHLIGDKVIQAFANLLIKSTSASALVGRMGGDEFAIWDSAVHSVKAAEMVFSNLLAKCKDITEKLGIQVTCSAGAVFNKCGTKDFTSVYQAADQALYEAKAQGKARLFGTGHI